jgi:hypothetical protein
MTAVTVPEVRNPFPPESFEHILLGVQRGWSINRSRNHGKAKGLRMPSKARFLQWIENAPGRRDRYMRAKRIGLTGLSDELLDLVDKPIEGDGPTRNAKVQHMRLRVDTRKWILAHLMPDTWGEKVEHKHEGKLGLTINVVTGIERNDSPAITLDDARDTPVRMIEQSAVSVIEARRSVWGDDADSVTLDSELASVTLDSELASVTLDADEHPGGSASPSCLDG